jgi:hypothetical protein
MPEPSNLSITKILKKKVYLLFIKLPKSQKIMDDENTAPVPKNIKITSLAMLKRKRVAL